MKCYNFKQACHANPGADTKYTGSSSYISLHIALKFSITSASNNVSLLAYKSRYSPRFFIPNTSHTF